MRRKAQEKTNYVFKFYICKHTKIHKFDPSLCCQQDVIAFDITVDGLVDVKVLEALQKGGRLRGFSEQHLPSKWSFFIQLSFF